MTALKNEIKSKFMDIKAKAEIDFEVLQDKIKNCENIHEKLKMINKARQQEYYIALIEDAFKTKIDKKNIVNFRTCLHEAGHAYLCYWWGINSNEISTVQVFNDGSGVLNLIKKLSPIPYICCLLAGFIIDKKHSKKIDNLSYYQNDFENIYRELQFLLYPTDQEIKKNILENELKFYSEITSIIIDENYRVIYETAKILQERRIIIYSELVKIFKGLEENVLEK